LKLNNKKKKPTLYSFFSLMILLRAGVILVYLLIVFLLILTLNKINKDVKKVWESVSANINSYFFAINSTIASQDKSADKFNDLIDVIYSKKKWFINNKTHNLTDWYELFIGLKDDLHYLGEYTGSELDDQEVNKQTDGFFSFLFSIRPRKRTLKAVLTVLTLGIGRGFINDEMAL
jgi:hypothetical protein